ncbi:hypothetical protein C7N83_13255, partial [Neisseria iguanae]
MKTTSPKYKLSINYSTELEKRAKRQNSGMARHILAGGKVVWIRRAGPHNPAWRYWLMGMLAKLLHAKVL